MDKTVLKKIGSRKNLGPEVVGIAKELIERKDDWGDLGRSKKTVENALGDIIHQRLIKAHDIDVLVKHQSMIPGMDKLITALQPSQAGGTVTEAGVNTEEADANPPDTGSAEAEVQADPITLEPIESIQTAAPFSNLLSIDPEVLDAITNDIRQHGYHSYEPIRIWAERNVVVDGHTKLQAARNAGLTHVPVVRLKFEFEQDALEHAALAQMVRRNLSDSEYLKLIEVVDERRVRGGKRGEESKTSGEVIDSAAETAQKLGITKTRVENARAVIDCPDKSVRQAVEEGKTSLHRAALKARSLKKAKQPDPRQKTFEFPDCSPSDATHRVEPEGVIADTEPDESGAAPAEAGNDTVATDREPMSVAAEHEQEPDEESNRPTARVESVPEPDLERILEALETILTMVGNSAELQARFRADIQVIKVMIEKAA